MRARATKAFAFARPGKECSDGRQLELMSQQLFSRKFIAASSVRPPVQRTYNASIKESKEESGQSFKAVASGHARRGEARPTKKDPPR